jgi:hypothetical protein
LNVFACATVGSGSEQPIEYQLQRSAFQPSAADAGPTNNVDRTSWGPVMCRQLTRALALASLFGCAAVMAAAQEPQRFTISEHRVEIFDAAGLITVRRGAGSNVVIVARRAGPDGSSITFGTDRQANLARFRVVFPVDGIDHIADPRQGHGHYMTIRLRADGTFSGGDGGWRERRGRGGEVEMGGSGGFRGSANLEIEVPAGRDVTLHLGAGAATLSGVSGDYTLDLYGADVEATDISGRYSFDTGSGDIRITGAQGTLRLDAGSGDVALERIAGDLLDVDTGSGDVWADDVAVDRARLDTGSGDVEMRRFRSRHTIVDTGSGDATLAYGPGPLDDLSIDTGSGDCTLTLPSDVDARLVADSGSGDVHVTRPGAIFERQDEDETVLRFGEGRSRIRIDTGSGGVTIR